MFNNLSLNFPGLDELITKLDLDNKSIEQTFKEINVIIKSLDDKKWRSREKERLDVTMLPYIDNVENNIFSYLNACVTTLSNAGVKYQEYSSEIINDSTNLVV